MIKIFWIIILQDAYEIVLEALRKMKSFYNLELTNNLKCRFILVERILSMFKIYPLAENVLFWLQIR